MERLLSSRGYCAAGGVGLPRSMLAAVLPRFGGPDVLSLEQVPLPRYRNDEVLVRVHAASVNPLDLRVREGYGRSLYGPLLPLVLGRDVAGVVVDAGPGGRGRGPVNVGDEVFGVIAPQKRWGTHAEYVAVPRKYLQKVPPGFGVEEAAAIPFAAMTAWRALQNTEAMRPRQRVLVLGAGGAVGACAVQLALSAGAVVVAACGPSSADRVRDLGCEAVLEHSGRGPGLRKLVKELGLAPFSAVVDLVGTESSESAGLRLLQGGGGRYTTVHGDMARLTDEYGLVAGGAAGALALAQKRAAAAASHGAEYSWTVMRPDEEAMHRVAQLAAEGRLSVPVSKAMPLGDAAAAHAALESGDVLGKVVLTAGKGF